MTNANDAFTPIFPDVTVPSGPKTVVILGVARGGASTVTGLAQLAGVDLGDDLAPNLEDPAFSTAAHTKAGNQDPQESMRASIRERNATKENWGWMSTGAATNLDELQSELRNPHLIIVTRDPGAIAIEQAANREAAQVDTLASQALAKQVRYVKLAQRWQVPTLLVSYEKAMTAPRRLASGIADFLGTGPLTEDQLKEAAGLVPSAKGRRPRKSAQTRVPVS